MKEIGDMASREMEIIDISSCVNEIVWNVRTCLGIETETKNGKSVWAFGQTQLKTWKPNYWDTISNHDSSIESTVLLNAISPFLPVTILLQYQKVGRNCWGGGKKKSPFISKWWSNGSNSPTQAVSVYTIFCIIMVIISMQICPWDCINIEPENWFWASTTSPVQRFKADESASDHPTLSQPWPLTSGGWWHEA